MKALRFHEFGGRDKLVVESVPDPVAGPGEVVVKVGACALNHLDVDLREGSLAVPARRSRRSWAWSSQARSSAAARASPTNGRKAIASLRT